MPNNVYMKRFDIVLTGNYLANSRHAMDTYETWLPPSHASYTHDRCALLIHDKELDNSK